MIHVIATIQLRSGNRDAFLAELHQLVPTVLQESGCLAYAPTVDLSTRVAAQGPIRSDVVTIVEQWSDLASLEAHLAAPHMAAYRQKVQPLVEQTSLQILQTA